MTKPLSITKTMMKNARDLGMAVVVLPDGKVRFEPMPSTDQFDEPPKADEREEEVTF